MVSLLLTLHHIRKLHYRLLSATVMIPWAGVGWSILATHVFINTPKTIGTQTNILHLCILQ